MTLVQLLLCKIDDNGFPFLVEVGCGLGEVSFNKALVYLRLLRELE